MVSILSKTPRKLRAQFSVHISDMFFNEEYTLVNKLETHTAAGIELWPCSKNLSRDVLTFIMKFTSLVYRLFEQVFKR